MAMESTMERPRALNCRFQNADAVQWCIVEVVLHWIVGTLVWFDMVCYGMEQYGMVCSGLQLMNVQWIGFGPHWVGPPLD